MEKISKVYTGTAVLLLNTVLLLLGCNLAAALYGWVNQEALVEPQRIPETEALTIAEMGALQYGIDPLQKAYAYAGRSDQDLIRLILEGSAVSFLCDETLSYRMQQFEGQFVTVDAAGFRWNAQRPPYPPEEDAYNIFVFGGSTTFGFGESDENTIPAFLAEQLETAQVYNFGQMAYFSLQEWLLFQELVEAGIDIDLAIFFNGLNEFFYIDGQPWRNENCQPPHTTWQQLREALRCDYGELCLPMQRLNIELPQTEATPEPPQGFNPDDFTPASNPVGNQIIIDRWLLNKAQIEQFAQQHGIETIFVIQPVPMYAYDLQYHPFVEELYDFGQINRAHWGYPLWEDSLEAEPEDVTGNILYLGRLAEGRSEILYVDRYHYTAPFMEEIAGRIASFIRERGLL